MLTHTLEVPALHSRGTVCRLIERLCKAEGLTMRKSSSLSEHPGSTHWHFGKGKEKGTLEITYLPDSRRVLLQVHDNRGGEWIATTMSRVIERAEVALGATPIS